MTPKLPSFDPYFDPDPRNRHCVFRQDGPCHQPYARHHMGILRFRNGTLTPPHHPTTPPSHHPTTPPPTAPAGVAVGRVALHRVLVSAHACRERSDAPLVVFYVDWPFRASPALARRRPRARQPTGNHQPPSNHHPTTIQSPFNHHSTTSRYPQAKWDHQPPTTIQSPTNHQPPSAGHMGPPLQGVWR